MDRESHTLPKAERLCGRKAVAQLFEKGKGGVSGCLRYKYLRRPDAEVSRIMVSVPKRSFKRAVKRNLLKRRIRGAYRLRKHELGPGVDILFMYLPREVLSFADIDASMAGVLAAVAPGPEMEKTE